MALNVASLLKATGDLAKSDPLGDIREKRGQDQVRQAQLAGANQQIESNKINMAAKQQEIGIQKQENDRKQQALRMAAPYSNSARYFTPHFALDPVDRQNAFDRTLQDNERIMGELGIDSPGAAEYKKQSNMILAVRAARGTPDAEKAVEDLRAYMRAGKKSVKILRDLNIPGYGAEEVKTSSPGAIGRDADNNIVFTNPSSKVAPKTGSVQNFGERGENGQITNIRSVDMNDPVSLQKAISEGLVIIGNVKVEDQVQNTTGAISDLSTPSKVDVTDGRNVILLGTGISNGIRAAFEGTPILDQFVEGGEQLSAQFTLNALGKDFEAALANNPRYAEGEMKRLSGTLTDVGGGTFKTEGDLISKLEGANKEFGFEVEKAAQRLKVATEAGDKTRAGHAIEDISVLTGTLQKIEQILKSNTVGGQAGSNLSRAAERLNQRRSQRTE
tara:strand:+ start:11859 stop:13193 length:1335 start_codon:yes stop_codon:yes gene_type:complete